MAAPRTRWAAELLHVWFHRLRQSDWFAPSSAVDAELARRFAHDLAMLARRPAHEFLTNPHAALAAVLLFDQVPRNTQRGTPGAFATDALARAIARGALRRGWDRRLSSAERQFLAMPLMHSENISDQRLNLAVFAPLGARYGFPFARSHYHMIARFGRYPHRNAVLGRKSTPAEERAITAGNAW